MGAGRIWNALPVEDKPSDVILVREALGLKRVEQALEQSRADLNRAQSIGNVGSWRLRLQTNTITWSDETFRIFGFAPRESPTYEQFLEAVHPEDRERVVTQDSLPGAAH